MTSSALIFGLFFTLFCLFLRFLPVVALAEVKTVLPEANPHWHPPDPEPGEAAPVPERVERVSEPLQANNDVAKNGASATP